MEDPVYRACWGAFFTSENTDKQRAHMYVNHWLMMWELRSITETQLRSVAGVVLSGPIGWRFWADARQRRLLSAGTRRERHFNRILDEVYRKIPAPPHETTPHPAAGLRGRPSGSAGRRTTSGTAAIWPKISRTRAPGPSDPEPARTLPTPRSPGGSSACGKLLSRPEKIALYLARHHDVNQPLRRPADLQTPGHGLTSGLPALQALRQAVEALREAAARPPRADRREVHRTDRRRHRPQQVLPVHRDRRLHPPARAAHLPAAQPEDSAAPSQERHSSQQRCSRQCLNGRRHLHNRYGRRAVRRPGSRGNRA